MNLTHITHEPPLAAIQALLDRLDPALDVRCDVPGCIHHGVVEPVAATWVGSVLAA